MMLPYLATPLLLRAVVACVRTVCRYPYSHDLARDFVQLQLFMCTVVGLVYVAVWTLRIKDHLFQNNRDCDLTQKDD